MRINVRVLLSGVFVLELFCVTGGTIELKKPNINGYEDNSSRSTSHGYIKDNNNVFAHVQLVRAKRSYDYYKDSIYRQRPYYGGRYCRSTAVNSLLLKNNFAWKTMKIVFLGILHFCLYTLHN